MEGTTLIRPPGNGAGPLRAVGRAGRACRAGGGRAGTGVSLVSCGRCLGALFLSALLLAALLLTPAARGQSSGDPEFPDAARAYALWERGYALHLLGRYEAAVDRFRASIEILPTAEGHTFLGWSLSMLGQVEEALAECKKAIALDPDYGNPYNDIGAYLIELGRPEEAVPWLEKAIAAKRYCCYQFAHFNLGRVRFMQGDLGGARRSFEEALRHEPDYPAARMALEYLDATIGKPI